MNRILQLEVLVLTLDSEVGDVRELPTFKGYFKSLRIFCRMDVRNNFSLLHGDINVHIDSYNTDPESEAVKEQNA
jgi:hypothetical protein